MRKPLPARAKVLEALASASRGRSEDEIAADLGVGAESVQGLGRMLDGLVYEGVVVADARGRFRLAGQETDEGERAPLQPRKAPKGLPAGFGRKSSNARDAREAPGARDARAPRAADRRDERSHGAKDARGPKDGRGVNAPARGGRDSARGVNVAGRGAKDDRAPGRGAKDRRVPPEHEMPGYSVGDAPRPTRGASSSQADRPFKESRETHDERDRGPRSRGAGRERRDGTLKVNPRGFGFVASPAAPGDDVYVSGDALFGAMHGDQVVVQIIARGGRGAEGQIVEIKARGSQRVSGILRRRGKSAWVELDDPRIRGPVVLTSEIDKAGEQGNSGKDGQVVVAQITRFPEVPGENPEGKLVAVLGVPGELSVETRKIILVHGIEELHSEVAVSEAEAYGAEVPVSMLEGREDLTHVPLPTIDPEDARDHDDAVWVTRTSEGGYELWVAIADVSSYVRPGTQIDAEAVQRGCSVYLPDRAIPMLPRALSSNLCSLLPDVVRLCLCVHAVLDAKGTVKKIRLVRGFMKSAAKLTYGGVARALGLTDAPPRDPKADAMVEGLRVAHELSRILRSRRMKRGALDFDLPEAVVKLDEEGHPTSISRRSGDPGMKKAYQLIEELMLFANEAVARWLLERELPGIYRVHLPPDPKKLDKLAAMTEMLGLEFDVENTQTPKALAGLLSAFARHPLSNVLNNLLLRSMKQATYDVQNLGHFGLASEAYLHFTSPIRRYPDLVVHRVVHAAVQAEARAQKRAAYRAVSEEQMSEAATQSSMAERRAMEVEREIVDVYRCFFMIDKIGERFEGTVSAFTASGAYVTLDEPFVDVMVRVEDMGPAYQIEDDGLSASSARSGDVIRLGDRMVVDIVDCAILRRTVYARRARPEGAGDDLAEATGGHEGRKGVGRARGADHRGARDSRGERGGREERARGSSGPTRGKGGPARGGKGTSSRDSRSDGGPSGRGARAGGPGKTKARPGKKAPKKGKRR